MQKKMGYAYNKEEKKNMEETGRVKRLVLIAVEWTVILLLLVALFMGYRLYKEYTRSTHLVEGGDITVTVEEGDGIRDIAATLKDAGLLNFEVTFYLKAMESSYRGKFQPGVYELNKGMSLEDMMAAMSKTSGGNAAETVRFTIPEGYSVEMIGMRLEEQGLCTAEEFYAAANRKDYSYEFLSSIPEDAGHYALQGFLFPDTYEVYVGASAEDIVKKMLDGFEAHQSLLLDTNDLSKGYSIYELVTIASIVEREAKLDEERPTIAGVVCNRLSQGMKLQMCPTVLYIITDGKYDVGQVLYSDLEVDDPYNTYYYEGLPKGPICSPGAASLEAAAQPESHTYLFYHTDDETKGNHIFTETYEEHLDTRIKTE